MAKTKAPTPQEIYRARKQREEEEKNSYLPPGLINHGNTCFMNSVLQGLMATRLLSDLVLFKPVQPSVQQYYATPLLSKRSPQLTNGYELAGPNKRPWVNSMPIGDMFLDVMHRSWDLQSQKQRQSISPKTLLAALGQKYDQYLDFAQQDAHEFLRILLDAMRMEEQDIIKKRQPPPAENKKNRRRTITSSNPNTTESAPEEEQLQSLADMIFGGKLTSILVCQKCKNISQTYEDFNDISLSLKPEDYSHRKRDRLKNFAKRLTNFPSTTLSVGMEVQRSSSVPPSPRGQEGGTLGNHEEPHPMPAPRRRSLDFAANPTTTIDSEQDADHLDSGQTTSKEDSVTAESDGSHVIVNSHGHDEKRVGFAEETRGTRKERDKEKKPKKDADDSWSKLGRRLSMSVGIGRGEKGEKRKSVSADKGSRELAAAILESFSMSSKSSGDVPTPPELTAPKAIKPGTGVPEGIFGSPLLGTSSPKQQQQEMVRASKSPQRPAIPLPRSESSPLVQKIQRTRSPKPPKPSAAETEYLRKILADTGSSASNKPFGLFSNHHSNHSHSSGFSSPTQGVWLGANHLSGIEECLRMFTAVEVLDGENMVGCRRCWKIANGSYKSCAANEEDSDSVPQSPEDSYTNGRPVNTDSDHSSPAMQTTQLPTSMSTPMVSAYSHGSGENRTTTSLPFNLHHPSGSSLELSNGNTPPSDSSSYLMERSYGGVSIPVISTTGPDEYSPSTNPSPAASLDSENDQDSARHHDSSLFSPNATSDTSATTHKLSVPSNTSGNGESEEESSDDESETSASGESENALHLRVNSDSQHPPISSLLPPSQTRVVKKKPPKPVIMRPAFKRYLISVAPPVLVIHLKRFQQVTKTPFISFSNGFKKLDDYVTFPEYLDLTPYMAPKKEDYGLGGQRVKKVKGSSKEKCMYRLYAVVVHIGNMLGGHYIAYTALPNKAPRKSTSSTPSPGSQLLDTPTQEKMTRKWAYISDTVVRLTTLEEVLNAKAYICMYERF